MPEDIAALVRSRQEETVASRKPTITKKSIKATASLATGRVMTYEEELAYALKTLRMNAKNLLQLIPYLAHHYYIHNLKL